MFKRKSTIVLSLVLFFSVIIQPVIAFANPIEEDILSGTSALRYDDQVVSDEELKTMQLVDQRVLTPEKYSADCNAIVKTYKKDELLSSQKNSTSIQDRVTTICEVVTIEPENSIEPPMQQTFSSGDKGATGYDSTSSYKFTLRIYYKFVKRNGVDHIQLTQVTGSNQNIDKTVNLSSQKVKIGATGFTMDGFYKTQVTDKYPTGASFSYSVNYAAINTTNYAAIGATYNYTLSRGTKSVWSGTLTCNY